MSALFDLTGKKALVTGGGRGLGRAIALGLAQHGADVAVTSRTVSELDETAQEVQGAGQQCLVVPGDASQKAEIDRVVGETAAPARVAKATSEIARVSRFTCRPLTSRPLKTAAACG